MKRTCGYGRRLRSDTGVDLLRTEDRSGDFGLTQGDRVGDAAGLPWQTAFTRPDAAVGRRANEFENARFTAGRPRT